MAFEKPGIVIDNGSYTIKAGFACDNHPISIFRTLVGRPKYLNGKYGREHYDVYVGDEALGKSEDLELSRPVENGIIVHWDNMERIWHHVYYRELKAAAEDRSVILATAATSTMDEKIKCCEIFFETLNAPALCIQPQNVLGMYGSGLTTGICVDLGHDTTDIVPVFEGGMLAYGHIRTGLAGSQISGYMKQCLQDCDTGYDSRVDLEDIQRSCYVTHSCVMDQHDCTHKYVLPSGESVNVSNECFMAGELIFQPDFVLKKKTDYIPLPEAIIQTVLKCDVELQTQMYDSIALCGGMAMVPGLEKRLTLEIEKKVDGPVQIYTSSEAYAVTWLGGAVFSSLGDAKKMWLEKEKYEEHGERIVKHMFNV